MKQVRKGKVKDMKRSTRWGSEGIRGGCPGPTPGKLNSSICICFFAGSVPSFGTQNNAANSSPFAPATPPVAGGVPSFSIGSAPKSGTAATRRARATRR